MTSLIHSHLEASPNRLALCCLDRQSLVGDHSCTANQVRLIIYEYYFMRVHELLIHARRVVHFDDNTITYTLTRPLPKYFSAFKRILLDFQVLNVVIFVLSHGRNNILWSCKLRDPLYPHSNAYEQCTDWLKNSNHLTFVFSNHTIIFRFMNILFFSKSKEIW